MAATQDEAYANDLSTSRLRIGEVGSEAITAITQIANRLAPFELKWPECLKTYEVMKQDATVMSGLNAGYNKIEKRFAEAKARTESESDRSKEATAFINWCFRNIDNQTLRSIARNAATFRENGFSILEKTYTKIQAGQYKGKYKIKKLGFRPPLSLDKSEPFVYTNQGRDIKSVKQDPNYFRNSIHGGNYNIPDADSLEIERKKFMLFGYNVTDDRPLGLSPLASAYTPWREKTLIGYYETVGVSKDMAGLPIFEVPLNILEKANKEPNSYEAKSIQSYQMQLANLHAGEQAYMIVPSDLTGTSSTAKQYNIKFLGVEGGSKAYNTKDLINDRKKAILDVFGAGFLNVGNDSVGANNLAESKNSVHDDYVDHDCKIIEEVINKDLIPQLLAMNEIFLPDEEMPFLDSTPPVYVDLDVLSSAVQRVGAVGYIPKTPDMIDEILELMGLKYRIPSDVREDETKFLAWCEKYLPDNTSRSGDGAKTAGEGTSKGGGSSRDNSVANKSN